MSEELLGRGAERTGPSPTRHARRCAGHVSGGDQAPLAGRGEPALDPGLPEAEHAHDDDQPESGVSAVSAGRSVPLARAVAADAQV